MPILWRTVRYLTLAILAFVFVGLAPSLARGQTASDAASGPIVTDRPTVTNSSVVVPAGSLQAENGFLDTETQGQSVVDGPETLVRYGLTDRTELRFTAPDYYYNVTNSGSSGTGFGDLALGVKQQLGPTHGFDVSATVFLSFPSGAAGVSSGGYDPGVQVAWSHGFAETWTAAGMFSLYLPTVGNTRNVTGESTFYIDRQLAKRWDAIVEYAGDFPERGGTRQLLHFAAEFRPGQQQHQQIDFHYGLGLTSATADHLIGVGYSFRFQVLHRQ
jgi:hypothetical protein